VLNSQLFRILNYQPQIGKKPTKGEEMKIKDLGIVFGFFIFGIGLGFLISPYLGVLYGMPAGILIGIGIGVVVQQIIIGMKNIAEEDIEVKPIRRRKRSKPE
jgi:hypothetical protein